MTEQEEETQSVHTLACSLLTQAGSHTKTNMSVPCVSCCHLLSLSLFSPPFPSFCVFHQWLFPWQTSSLCCVFDSQCQLMPTTVFLSLSSLSICRAADTDIINKGSSPVACPSRLFSQVERSRLFQRAWELFSNVINVYM